MLYERLYKQFISHHPFELLSSFKADYQHVFKWIISHHQVDNRPLSKWFMNGYPNSLSATIHVNY